jgi:flagellar hook protein FlgE
VSNINTGVLNFSFPGEGIAGKLLSNTREGSSVDITSVYLQMINDQSIITGNLKAVETLKEINARFLQI